MAIAIVGSGPAGFYTADMLSKALPNQQVHIFERLSLPYGLVRYGVAPDHPGTKGVVQLFERVMKRANTRFFGNVEIGSEIGIDLLESAYDVVVVATGANAGRRYECQGIEQACNVSGLDLAGWFNGKAYSSHEPFPSRAKSVCIIGNGNVSLDAARLLAKPASTLRELGVPEAVVGWREGLGLEEIHICGRRNAAETKFAVAELEELGQLVGFRPVVGEGDIEDACGANMDAMEVLRRYARQPPDSRQPIHFHFNLEISSCGEGVLTSTHARRGVKTIAAQMIVHAIGQRAVPLAGLPFNEETGCIENEQGLIRGKDRTYVVGWAAKAGGGQIAVSRSSAQALLPRILEHFSGTPTQSPSRNPDGLADDLPGSVVSWDDALLADPWRKRR
jgi:ferredoxin--NADP+ reductase